MHSERIPPGAPERGERVFRAAFDGAPHGMSLISLDPASPGRFLEVNCALSELTGYSKQDLVGRDLLAIAHPDDRQGVADILRRLNEDRIESVEMETRIVRSDGSLVRARLNASAVRDRGGRPICVVQLQDVTPREAQDDEWVHTVVTALQEDRFVLFAQPVLDLRSGRFTRAEVLLRMRGEQGTGDVIYPGDFLPVAERFGLMGEIDRWVLRAVMPLLRQQGAVAFNVSAGSIGDLALTQEIETILDELAVDPARLTVEIAETAAIRDIQAARLFAERLHRVGCSLAIDDFGTGYGSFTHLKHLTVDYLKIDMQFIRDLVQSESDRQVVRSIVGIADAFGVKTIAEGVENAETLELLHGYGVDLAQGYFLGRPAPVAADVCPPPRTLFS